MKIRCLTTFLDGRDRFEAGDVRQVDDDRAARFIAAGWAADAAGDEVLPQAASPASVDLDVHNVTHKTQVTYG